MNAFTPRISVTQIGARMHYAVPRILAAKDMLERLFTDFYPGRGLLNCFDLLPEPLRPRFLKRALGRFPEGVSSERIIAFNDFGCEYARRRRRESGPGILATYLWAGKTFCERVVKCGFGSAEGVYAFNSAGLEVFKAARRQGLFTILEQTIAPLEIEQQLLHAEKVQYPEWRSGSSTKDVPNEHVLTDYIARERAEWNGADLILCGSDFVRQSIRQCGGPDERCVVVPYGVGPCFGVPARRTHSGPLRVLTVGEVGLRKGSPYVLNAAKSLGDRAQFRMVGSVSASRRVCEDLQAHVEIAGPVPRSEIPSHYQWADVFLLPSLCEGSATVTYEAMAAGLPVITTVNTGSLVRDGIEGFVIPIRSAEAIEEALDKFIADPELLLQMSRQARLRSEEGSLEAYAGRLQQAIQGVRRAAA